jgi:hypothetical protein
MTSSRRRLGLQLKLLDNNSSQFWVLRTFLFGEMARRIPTMEVGRVPSLGLHHREERATTTVGIRET